MHCLQDIFINLALLWLAFAGVCAQNDFSRDQRRFEIIDRINYTVFEHARTSTKLSYVTNSGICESTPRVNQYSGYLSVNNTLNMFFWFFEARQSPTTAPLGMWLTGGPGCSSMMALFVENGPCYFPDANSTEPVINPFSWNTVANMLYIDQPGQSGFRYVSFSLPNSAHPSLSIVSLTRTKKATETTT